MGLTIQDLQPRNFEIDIRGVKLQSKPLRLSHALIVAKIGNVFQDTAKANKQDIKQAEIDMDQVIAELIPELKDVQLDMADTMTLIEQLMKNITPSESRELEEKGVKFDTDPKAGVIG